MALGAGGSRSGCSHPLVRVADSGCVLTWRRAWGLCRVSPQRALIPSWGLHRCDVISCPAPPSQHHHSGLHTPSTIGCYYYYPHYQTKSESPRGEETCSRSHDKELIAGCEPRQPGPRIHALPSPENGGQCSPSLLWGSAWALGQTPSQILPCFLYA